ncbi:uncharacterized protein IL334_002447 [Kwoniella shivajii]|uniref:Restriction of telomere capping protein 4 n=1 Tax=Kwoniella shivajii TaxID=564305 RepID=A0ABZ1CW33_9TREE|nr:hypothetical protein IL334_002447 [Kwoniella shivajii]
MESLRVHSSQSSTTGGGGSGGGSGMGMFGFDPSKSRPTVSVPKKRTANPSTTKTKAYTSSSYSQPSASTTTTTSTTASKRVNPSSSSLSQQTKVKAGSSSQPQPTKKLGKSYSNDPDGLINSLLETRNNLERVADKQEYKNSLMKGKEREKAKGREKQSRSDGNGNGNGNGQKISKYHDHQRNPIPTQISSPSSSLSTASDDEDEISLGRTPPENMHNGYKSNKQSQQSQKNSGSPSPFIKKKSHSSSTVKMKVLVPPSSDVEESRTPRSKFKHDPKMKSKKRKSSDEDTTGLTRDKNRRRILSYDDLSDNETERNDDDQTPKAKSKSSKIKNEDPDVPSISDDEEIKIIKAKKARDSTSHGHKFFEQLEQMSSDNDFEWESLNDHTDITKSIEVGLDDEDDFSPEDKEYLIPFKSVSELCPYCSGPFPVEPSPNLLRLKAELHSISTPMPTSRNPDARSLNWQRHIDFCALHQAETSVIPLGIRDGYPKSIDFAILDQRLERGWRRDRLDELVLRPETSHVFNRVVKEINQIGKSKWAGMTYQSKPENLEAVKPGYYGDLGRTILINHFLSLRKWGHFPSLKSSDPHFPPSIDPLTWTEFVSHVLVPESAHLLIMSDQNYTHFSEDAYKQAQKIRKESVNYGTWKFREDDDESQNILEEIENNKDEKKLRLKKIYKKKLSRQLEVESEASQDDKENIIPVQMVTPKHKFKVVMKNEEDIIEIEDCPKKDSIKHRFNPTINRTYDGRSQSGNEDELDNEEEEESHVIESKQISTSQPEAEIQNSQASTDYDAGWDDGELLKAVVTVG